MHAHQQRFADGYKAALKFPLVLHLAEIACEYALPYGEEALTRTGQDTRENDSLAEGVEDGPE